MDMLLPVVLFRLIVLCGLHLGPTGWACMNLELGVGLYHRAYVIDYISELTYFFEREA